MKRLFKHLIYILIIAFILESIFMPVPNGISLHETSKSISDIEFLYDLTYIKNEDKVHEQEIFNNWLQIIEGAEDFIIIDMFLFNDDYNKEKFNFPEISRKLADALIDKKKNNPEIRILFITDEINNFYGVYEGDNIKRLKENNIDVVITNNAFMRDSNPIYSGVWRNIIKWFGTEGNGWITNPFSPDAEKVTLRGYLKLLNFKANHRKLLITDKEALVTSANIHDASAYHSNIGFRLKGDIIKDLIKSELRIAVYSGYEYEVSDFNYETKNNNSKEEDIRSVSLITESKIKDSIINELNNSDSSDKVYIGMFYLSHRGIIETLINAANRGVDIKIILDPNKDAFGIKKNGIPNRQVAKELRDKSDNKIQIRWYDTHGEQYHSKMIFIQKYNESIIIGGSGNFTRRNLNDYNLETDILIETEKNSKIDREVREYFDRIWNNDNGHYTVDYSKYKSESFIKTIIYRIQEWSGFSTF